MSGRDDSMTSRFHYSPAGAAQGGWTREGLPIPRSGAGREIGPRFAGGAQGPVSPGALLLWEVGGATTGRAAQLAPSEVCCGMGLSARRWGEGDVRKQRHWAVAEIGPGGVPLAAPAPHASAREVASSRLTIAREGLARAARGQRIRLMRPF
jgi:hypothetical protein